MEKDRYWPHEILAEAYIGLGEKDKALAALQAAEDVLPIEFPGDAETVTSITARLEKMRGAVE
jgi:Ni,Fe-hydrogenase III large subunit